MSNRGVLLLIFDIPNTTSSEQRKYRKFRKEIIKSGFMMFQESVYVKLLRNSRSFCNEINKVRQNIPEDSDISVLPLTAAEFSRMQTIAGNKFDYNKFLNDIIFI